MGYLLINIGRLSVDTESACSKFKSPSVQVIYFLGSFIFINVKDAYIYFRYIIEFI